LSRHEFLAALHVLRYATPENLSLPERWMTYVVTENCIKCKYMDCVEVCPVDCFYEGENMLVIHPDECIDCGVCEPNARRMRSSPTPNPPRKMARSERRAGEDVANITQKKEPPADAKDFDGVPGKYDKYFSSKPGTGD